MCGECHTLGSPADIPQQLTASELLTIVQQARTDFGNMRDLLLRAFHKEPMSYAIETGKQHAISARTTKRRVCEWLKAQFISQLSHGKYEKRTEKDL